MTTELKTFARNMVLPFVLMTLTSVQGLSAPLYNESWEDGIEIKPTVMYNGGCYTKDKYGYESFAVSSKRARLGTKSMRVELHGMDKGVCGDYTDGKSRAEIRHAVGDDRLYYVPLGTVLWTNLSIYVPSDEGTFNSWWNDTGGNRFIIYQLMGVQLSSSPEVLMLLGANGRLDVEVQYSEGTTTTEKKQAYNAIYNLKPDTWHDIVVNSKRSNGTDGFTKVWVDDKLVVNRSGPSAIAFMPSSFYKQGEYFGYELRNEVYVVYTDEIRMSDKSGTYADVDVPAQSIQESPPAPPSLQVN